jgi:hypothetical protein
VKFQSLKGKRRVPALRSIAGNSAVLCENRPGATLEHANTIPHQRHGVNIVLGLFFNYFLRPPDFEKSQRLKPLARLIGVAGAALVPDETAFRAAAERKKYRGQHHKAQRLRNGAHDNKHSAEMPSVRA